MTWFVNVRHQSEYFVGENPAMASWICRREFLPWWRHVRQSQLQSSCAFTNQPIAAVNVSMLSFVSLLQIQTETYRDVHVVFSNFKSPKNMVCESSSMPTQRTLDSQVQSITDNVINPLCHLVPSFISPLHLTCLAFICGLISCWQIYQEHNFQALVFWSLNRLLGGLDGAVARHRGKESELGAFLDLLSSFWVHSTIPICCGLAVSALDDLKQPFTHLAPSDSPWLSIAVLEAMFHIHNFVLFYAIAAIEKHKQVGKIPTSELTSIVMRPALVESFESGVIFTLMLAWPRRIEALCWAMVLLMAVGTIHRLQWSLSALSDHEPHTTTAKQQESKCSIHELWPSIVPFHRYGNNTKKFV